MIFLKNNEYNIKYINGSGNVSRRKIRVLSVCDPSYGKDYLRGWCYLSGEERTFRYDRILEAELCCTQEACAFGTACTAVAAGMTGSDGIKKSYLPQVAKSRTNKALTHKSDASTSDICISPVNDNCQMR